jgi:hypothetical protein
VKRYHIIAGGSDEWPDLDYHSDVYPSDLLWKYPFVDVQLLVPIPLEALRNGLQSPDPRHHP